MEQSQHVNIAARIQQLIVSRHINKQETKMQKAKLKLTNDLYNKYNAFQNLQKEPEILISILEQAKSPRSNYVYGI